jgi:hypothetical protein
MDSAAIWSKPDRLAIEAWRNERANPDFCGRRLGSPRVFRVAPGPHGWLRMALIVATAAVLING